jgi:phosphohistidine phosphatase
VDLYLIRHAEAGDRERWEGDDAERPLTEAGHEQAQLLAAGLQQRGVTLEVVVTSPLVRARQTAEGVAENWNEPAPELQACADLAPGGKPKKVAKFVTALEAEAVALVGHMPDLGELAGWLLGSRKVTLDFAKAGVALIRFENAVGKGAGELAWMVTPDWLAEPELAGKRRK